MCELPEDEIERKQAEAICNQACLSKCPETAQVSCPLLRYKNETEGEYNTRCSEAAKLAQVFIENNDFIPVPFEASDGVIGFDGIASPSGQSDPELIDENDEW